MQLDIDDIKIGERHRKDLGDIDALAASIEAIGLLHPVVVLSDNTLVVGERRLAAYKQLKREKIPANVARSLDDVDKFLRAECDENTCRKDFTPEEAQAVGGRVEVVAKVPLQESQAAGQKRGGQTAGKGRPKDSFRGIPPKAKQEESARAAAVAAKAVGMDRQKYTRIKAVVDAWESAPKKKKAAARALVDEMNRTGKVNGVYKKLKVAAQVDAINKEPPPLPVGPFRVIAVDPPWLYEARANDPSHRIANPYPSMSIEEIAALDIGGLAHDDCVLWLWTTNAHIMHAFGIVEVWGFEYKTMLTWLKNKMGTGDWLRGKTEHCLMAVKGKPVIDLTNQTTALEGKVRKHSQKPEEFYAMVEKMCPGSKVEVFNRTKRKGWIGHGDEANSLE